MDKDKKPIKIYTILLDVLFPIKCLSCKKEGSWICDKCLSKIPVLIDQVCPICEKVATPQGRTCLSCKKRTSLEGIFTISSYTNPILKMAIHYYKYRFISDLSVTLGEIAVKSLILNEMVLPDLIIPVPLHSRRLRWRGFNQSHLLAEFIAIHLTPGFKIPVENNFLTRTKYTKPQMSLNNTKERKINVQNAFTISNTTRITDKNIWLVDDVATTGATIEACSNALKKAGAKSIFAIVLARQKNNL